MTALIPGPGRDLVEVRGIEASEDLSSRMGDFNQTASDLRVVLLGDEAAHLVRRWIDDDQVIGRVALKPSPSLEKIVTQVAGTATEIGIEVELMVRSSRRERLACHVEIDDRLSASSDRRHGERTSIGE